MQAVGVAQIPQYAGNVAPALYPAGDEFPHPELKRHERRRETNLRIPFLEAEPAHDHLHALGVIRIGEVDELPGCDLALEQNIDQGLNFLQAAPGARLGDDVLGRYARSNEVLLLLVG